MRRKRVHTKILEEEKAKADEPKPGFQGWGPVMKKFLEEKKAECAPVEVDRSVHTFEKKYSTCSKYEGTADVLGWAGYGSYTFSNGVLYEGDFDDGLFHGEGMLTYPSGIIVRGTWNKGVMTYRTLYFADGLRYSEEDWDYCKMPDRRFSIEYDVGLQPAMQSLLTADQPTRDIPPGHYDTIDGFYHAKHEAIYQADEPTAIVRCPIEKEIEWITENCRVDADVPLGPREHLYEEWPEPQLNYLQMKMNEAKEASCTSRTWGFEGEKEDDGWRLKFSQSKARLTIIPTRSVAEFGAFQQKSRFRWGDDVID